MFHLQLYSVKNYTLSIMERIGNPNHPNIILASIKEKIGKTEN